MPNRPKSGPKLVFLSLFQVWFILHKIVVEPKSPKKNLWPKLGPSIVHQTCFFFFFLLILQNVENLI